MIAHKISTTISSDGNRHGPEQLRHLFFKDVEVILLLQDTQQKKMINKTDNEINRFYYLIKEYNKIDEPDLDLKTIYHNRKKQDERQFDFS